MHKCTIDSFFYFTFQVQFVLMTFYFYYICVFYYFVQDYNFLFEMFLSLMYNSYHHNIFIFSVMSIVHTTACDTYCTERFYNMSNILKFKQESSKYFE